MPKISLDLELNTKGVEKGMKEAEGYISETQKRLKSEKGIELTINLAKLRLELDKTNKILKEAIKEGDPARIIKLKVDQEALKKEITIANRALNNFANTGNQNYSALARMFDNVSLTGGKLTGVLGQMSPALGGAVQSFTGMSAGAGAAGAAIGGVAVGLAKASQIASSFETAWAGVTKTVDGTPEQMDALKQQFIQLTKEIPLTFEELSSFAAVGGSLGIPISQMGKFTETVAKLSVAVDGLSGEEAATMLAKIGTVTGEGTANIDKMGSTLVALGNNFAATEGEILDFTNRIASSAGNLGVGSAELMAVATTFTSMGLSAERGATAFNGAVTKMAVAVAGNTKELKDIALVAGVSADEFKKKWGEDAFGAFQLFTKGLSESANQTKNIVDILGTGNGEIETLQKLGREDGLALLADALKTARHEMNLATGEVSALNAEASKRFDTLASQATIMSNKWRAAFEPTGTMLNDTILKPLFKVLGDSASYFQLFIGILVIGLNIIKLGFNTSIQYIAATMVAGWNNMINYTKYLYDVMSKNFQGIGIVIGTWVKVAGLYFMQAGSYISQFVKNAGALFVTFSENIGIAFGNIAPLIGAGMNEMLKGVADGINKAIKFVNGLTEELKSIPLIGEKLAGFTKMTEVGAGSVNFGSVKQFKALPELLKIDASKSAEIEATWSNMYSKLGALGEAQKPNMLKISDLVDQDKLNNEMKTIDSSIKKFADSQSLAKAKVANAEAAQRAKIENQLKEEIDTGKKKKPTGGSSDATKKKEEELRKQAQMDIDAVKKSEDTEKNKALKIKAIKEKLSKDLNDIQGKSIENDFDASEKTLEQIEKAEKEKREAYKKTSEKIDDAKQKAIDGVVEHMQKIEKLKEKYKELADEAGKNLRELNKELLDLNGEKAQNQADTFNKLAERRSELLKDQKELEKDISEAIAKGGDEDAWKKIAEDQEKLAGIKKEISYIDKTIPADLAKQVEYTKSLTEAEQEMLALKKEQDEVDKKIETNRQKRLVNQAILNGGKILITGDGGDIKAQVENAQGIMEDLTDFAAKEYAVDTKNKQDEIDAKIAIEKLAMDQNFIDLQNLDISRRELDSNYSIFFKAELDGRIEKLKEFIRVAQEAASLASQAGVSSQSSAILQSSTASAGRAVTINNTIQNQVQAESVVRDITKKL